MSIQTHVLGLPRIGETRQLKKAVESYWKGSTTSEALRSLAERLKADNLRRQKNLDFSTLGDFSFYDRMLDLAMVLDALPGRFRDLAADSPLDRSFAVARGSSEGGRKRDAAALRKWFNTNYHYVVPEFDDTLRFRLDPAAAQLVFGTGPAAPGQKISLLGPATFLLLGSSTSPSFDRIRLVPALAAAYAELISHLAGRGFEWIQIEEPILVQDQVPEGWEQAVRELWAPLARAKKDSKILLTTYFDSLDELLPLAADICRAAADGVHLDLCARGWDPALLTRQLAALPGAISLGVIDGRNIWKADLDQIAADLAPFLTADRDFFLSTSCSLLHVPYSLEPEAGTIDARLLDGLAFAEEKIRELELLGALVISQTAGTALARETAAALESHRAALSRWRAYSGAAENHQKQAEAPYQRGSYEARLAAQEAELGLPSLPTTTIGSFPQTGELRRARKEWKLGKISQAQYEQTIRDEIGRVIREQEALGLDVLVHGEPERNDMVEYFTELLDGYAPTANGWVQSYGSRCVKPAIIFADIRRRQAMTLDWIGYAQSLTEKPVKGMLTGPVTMVKWAFPRTDISLREQAFQVADALALEVADLEAAGTRIIQIDEAAFKEAQPIKRRDWDDYGKWAAQAFRRAARNAADGTQIHTHMCYSDFSVLLDAVAAMDADVLTIETSRSEMALLGDFSGRSDFHGFGPGVYDIHSPLVPDQEAVERRIRRALEAVDRRRLWVNPDCGLKTRTWDQVRPSLANLVAAAKKVREEIGA